MKPAGPNSARARAAQAVAQLAVEQHVHEQGRVGEWSVDEEELEDRTYPGDLRRILGTQRIPAHP